MKTIALALLASFAIAASAETVECTNIGNTLTLKYVPTVGYVMDYRHDDNWGRDYSYQLENYVLGDFAPADLSYHVGNLATKTGAEVLIDNIRKRKANIFAWLSDNVPQTGKKVSDEQPRLFNLGLAMFNRNAPRMVDGIARWKPVLSCKITHVHPNPAMNGTLEKFYTESFVHY